MPRSSSSAVGNDCLFSTARARFARCDSSSLVFLVVFLFFSSSQIQKPLHSNTQYESRYANQLKKERKRETCVSFFLRRGRPRICVQREFCSEMKCCGNRVFPEKEKNEKWKMISQKREITMWYLLKSSWKTINFSQSFHSIKKHLNYYFFSLREVRERENTEHCVET